jgi:hypothetical protein
MNVRPIEYEASTKPDYRLRRDGEIDIISDRARHRVPGSNSIAAGTRIVFRSHQETEEYIEAARRDGFTVEY